MRDCGEYRVSFVPSPEWHLEAFMNIAVGVIKITRHVRPQTRGLSKTCGAEDCEGPSSLACGPTSSPPFRLLVVEHLSAAARLALREAARAERDLVELTRRRWPRSSFGALRSFGWLCPSHTGNTRPAGQRLRREKAKQGTTCG